MKLFNLSKQAEEEVSSDLATGMIKSGTHTPYEDEDYVVTSNDGEPRVVKGNKLYESFDFGSTIPTQEIYDQAIEGNKYDNSNFQAAAAAAIRAVSFNSDGVLIGMGVKPETIKKLKKYNPYITTGVEMGVLAGTLLVSPLTAGIKRAGALAGLARGAGTASKFLPTTIANRATIKLGEVAGKAIGKALPATATAKGIAEVMGAGLGAAVEGSLYGMGSYLDEDVLGDAKFSAEAFFANAGEGAKWGGILGAGFPLAGKALKGTAKAIFGGEPPKIPKEAIDPNLPPPPPTSFINKISRWIGKTIARLPEDVIEKYMKNPDLYEGTYTVEGLASKIAGLRSNIESALATKQQSAESIAKSLGNHESALKTLFKDKQGEIKQIQKELHDIAIQEREAIKSVPVQEDDVIHAHNIIKGAEDQAEQLHNESFRILEDIEKNSGTPLVFNGKAFIHGLKQERNKRYQLFDEKRNPLPLTDTQRADLDYSNRIIGRFNKMIENKLGNLDLPTIKQLVKVYQDEIKKRGGTKAWGMGTGDQIDLMFAKDFQRSLNNFIYNSMRKVGNDDYGKVMGILQDITESLEYVHKKVGYRDNPEFLGKLRNSLAGAVKGNVDDSVNLIYLQDLEDALPRKAIVGENKFTATTGEVFDTLESRMNKNKIEWEYARTKGMRGLEEDQLRLMQDYPDDVRRMEIAEEEKNLLENSIKSVNNDFDNYLNSEIIAPFEKIESYSKMKADRIKQVEVLDEISKLKEKLKSFSSFDEYTGEKKVNLALSGQDDSNVKRVFGKMAELNDESILEIAKILRVQESFEKSAVAGSRNVQLWKTLFSVAGIAGGSFAGPLGVAIGALVGYNLDVYGPKVMKRFFRLMSEIDGKITPIKMRETINKIVPEEEQAFNKIKTEAMKQVDKDRKKSTGMIKKSVGEFYEAGKKAGKIFTIQELIDDEEEQQYNDYPFQMEKYKKYLDNKESVNTNFYDENDSLSLTIPNTTNQIFSTYQMATNFLASKFPKAQDADILGEYKPSNLELYKFSQYAGYIDKPARIFKEVASGVLPDEGLEVLANVYPEHFKLLIDDMINNLDVDKIKQMPMSRRIALQKLLGVDLNAGINYNHLMQLQTSGAQQEQQEQQKGLKKVNPKMASVEKTDLNRITSKPS